MASLGQQREIQIKFGGMRSIADAPGNVVRQCDSPATALTVAMRAGKLKLANVASCINKSESYVSRLASGSRPIPRKLIAPLCAATGTNLLAQVVALLDAIDGPDEIHRLSEQMACHIEIQRRAA